MDQAKDTRPVVAVIGGGQLARMMAESSIALGLELRALVEASDGATGQALATSIVGMPGDTCAVAQLIDGADVVTFEHEHIPASVFDVAKGHLPAEPPRTALLYAQDKLAMREKLTELGIPCPRWAKVSTLEELASFGDAGTWPIVVKTPVGGYDGHGVRVIHQAEDAVDWLAKGTLLAEDCVPFTSEIASLSARTPSGQIASWPVASTEQVEGVCSVVTAPAQGLTEETRAQATSIGETVARELGVTGVLAVEMFVVGQGSDQHVLVNELAMRPHNTGHWTIDGAFTSQFEQHLRAVLDLPLGSTDLVNPGTHAVMVNLLGSEFADPARHLASALADHPRAKVHLYGKEVRPGRKLGHVTVVDKDPAVARAEAEAVVATLRG